MAYREAAERLKRGEREVRFPIAPVGDSRILMCIDDERGKDAHSHFTVVERFAARDPEAAERYLRGDSEAGEGGQR